MALKDIEKLSERLERDPGSKLFVPLAEEYRKEGMFDEAVEVLIRGIGIHPGYMSARVLLGKIYLEKGLLDEARVELETVISAIPDNLYAHKKLAEIYRDTGEKDKALRSFHSVLQLNPMDEEASQSLHDLEGIPSEAPPEESFLGEPVAEGKGFGDEIAQEEVELPGATEESVSFPETSEDTEIAEKSSGEDLNAFRDALFGGHDDEAGEEPLELGEDLGEEVSVTEAAGEDEGEFSFGDVAQALGKLATEEEAPVAEPRAFVEGEATAVPEAIEALAGADRLVSEGKYLDALEGYRRILRKSPEERHVLQRLEELRALLRLLGKDKEGLISRLNALLDGVRKRHGEFLGRP